MRKSPLPARPGPKDTLRPRGPLPEFWPYGRFRGHRISLLPAPYLAWAMRRRLPDLLRAALRAEAGLRALAADQREGR